MLRNILILSSKEVSTNIVSILHKHNPNLSFKVISSTDQLERCKKPYLAKARLISFLTAIIVPKHILDALGYGAINFHPGPPIYPGWAASNFAVYEGAKSFRATAHYMNEKIDAGEIVGLDLFEVDKDIEVNQLIDKALEGLIRLLNKLAFKLTREEPLTPLPIPWGLRKTTKKMFADYCELTKGMSKSEFLRRTKAFGGFSTAKLHFKSGDQIFEVDASDSVQPNKAYQHLHGVRFVEVLAS